MVGEDFDKELASLLYLGDYERPSHQVLPPVCNQVVQSLFELRFFFTSIVFMALITIIVVEFFKPRLRSQQSRCQQKKMTKKEDKRTIVSSCTRCMGTLFLSADVYSHWLHAVFVSAQHHCVNSLLHGITGDSCPVVSYSRSQIEDLGSCGDSTIPNSGSTSKKRALTHSAEAPSSERASLSEILEQKTLLPRVTSITSDYKSTNTTDRQRLESGSTVFTCTGSGIINSALSPGLWSVESAQKPVRALKFETPKKIKRHDSTQISAATPRNFKETSSILNSDNAILSPEPSDGSQSTHATRVAELSSSANQSLYNPRRRKAQTSVNQEGKKSPLVDVVGSEHSGIVSDSFRVGQRRALSMCQTAEARDETDSWSTNEEEVDNSLAPQPPRPLTPFRTSALRCPTAYSPERTTGRAKRGGNNSVTQTLWEAFERELTKIEWKDNGDSTVMFGCHSSPTEFQTRGLDKPDNSNSGRQKSSVLKQVGVKNVSYPSIELSLESRDRLKRKTTPVCNASQLKTSSFLQERSDVTYSVSTNDKVREAGVGPGNTVNEAIGTLETDVQDAWPDSYEKSLNFKVVTESSKDKLLRTNKVNGYEEDCHDFSLMSSREQQVNPEEIHMVESLSKMEEILESAKSSGYAQSTSTFSLSEQSMLAVRASKPTVCTRPLFCPRRSRKNVVTNSRDKTIDVGANVSLLSACSQKLYSKVEAKPTHKWVVYPEKVSQRVISVTDSTQKSPRNVYDKVVAATFSSDVLSNTIQAQDERSDEEKKPLAHHYEQRVQGRISNSSMAPPSTHRKPETKQEKLQNEQIEEMIVDPRSKKRKRGVSGRQAGTPQASKQLSTSISQEWANIKEQFKSIYHSTHVEKANCQKKKTEAPVRVSSPAASIESQFDPPTAVENILLNKNPLRSTILLCKSGFVTTYEEYQRVKDQGPGLVRSSRKGLQSTGTPSLMRFLEQIEKDEAVTKDSKEDSYSADIEERIKPEEGVSSEVKAERHATDVKRSEREMSAFPDKRGAYKKQASPLSLVLHHSLILQNRKQLEGSDKNDTRKSNSMSYPCIPRTNETSKVNKVKHCGQHNVKKQSMFEKKSDREGYGGSFLECKMNQKLQDNQPIHTPESQTQHRNAKRPTSKIPIPKKEKWIVTKKQLNAVVSSELPTLAENKKIRTNDSSSLLDVFLNLNHSPRSTSMSQCSLPHVGSNTIFEPSGPKPLSENTALIVPHLSLSPTADKLALMKCLTSAVSKVSSAPVASSLASSASPKKRERVSGVEVKRALRRTRERTASAPSEKQPASEKTSGKSGSTLNKSESRLNRAQDNGCEVPPSQKGRGENAQRREGPMRKTAQHEREVDYPDPKSRACPEDIAMTAAVPVLTQGIENTKLETDCDKKQTPKEVTLSVTADTFPEVDFATKKENQIPESKVKRVTEIKRNISQVQLMSNSAQRHKTSPVKAKSLPSISKQPKMKQSKLDQEDNNLPLPQGLGENQTYTAHEKPESDGQVLLAPIIPSSPSQHGCALSSLETARPASTTILDDPRNEISGQSPASLKLNANRVSFSMDNVCQKARGKLTWKGTLTFRKRAQRFSQTRLMGKNESGTVFKNPSVSCRQSSSVSSCIKVQRGQSESRIQTKKKDLVSNSSSWSKKKPISRMETNSSTAKSRTRKESCQVRKHETGNAKNKLHVDRGTARKKLDSRTTQSGTQLQTENPVLPPNKPNRDSTLNDAANGNVTTASKGDENPRALVMQQVQLKEVQPNKKTVKPVPLPLTKPAPKKTMTTVANRAKAALGTRKSILLGSRVPSKIAVVNPGTNRREKLLNNMNQEEATSRANNYKQASLSFPEANNQDVASGTATSSSLHVPSRVDATKDELQDLLNKVKLDSKLTTQTSNLGLSGKFSSKRKGVNSGDKMSRSWSEARLARPPRYLKKNITHRNAAVCLVNATKAAQNLKAKCSLKENKALDEMHEKSSSKEKMVNSGQAALARDEKAEKTVNEAGTDSVSFSNNVVEVSEQPPTTGNEESSKSDNLNTYVLTSFALPEQSAEAIATKQLKSPPSQLQSDFSRNETDVHAGHSQALTSSCSLQQNKRKTSENESLPSTEEPTKTDADSGICTAESSRQKLTSLGYECRNQNGTCKPEHLDILSLAITDSMEQSLNSDITIINRLNSIVSSEADPSSFKQKQMSLRIGELDTKDAVTVQENVPNDSQLAGKFLPGGFNESSSRRLLTQDYLHAKEKNASYGMKGIAEARNQLTTASVDVSATFSMRKEGSRSQGDFVVSSCDTKTANRQNDDAYNAIVEKYSSSSISNSMLHRREPSLTNIKDTPHSEGLDEVSSPSLILSRSQCNLETGEAVLINVISGGRIRQMKTLRPVLAPSENCTTSFDVHAVRGISECKSSVSMDLKTAEPQIAPPSQQNQSVFVLGVPESLASNQSFLVEPLASEDTLVSVNMEQEARDPMLLETVERSPEMLNFMNRNLGRNWERWEDEFYFSPAKDSVDSQHCSNDFYIEQVNTGVQSPRAHDRKDNIPTPRKDVQGKGDYALKSSPLNLTSKNAIDRRRHSKPNEKAPFRTEGSVSLVGGSTKQCKRGLESEATVMNKTIPQPFDKKLANETDRDNCLSNSLPFFWKKEHGRKTEQNLEDIAGTGNEGLQEDVVKELRKIQKPQDPSMEKEKQHPSKEIKDYVSMPKMLFVCPASNIQNNKTTRFQGGNVDSPVDDGSVVTNGDQNRAPRIDRDKSCSPKAEERPTEASNPNDGANTEESPEAEVCRKSKTKKQQVFASGLKSPGVPRRKKEKTHSKVKTLRDLLWSPVGEELKQRLREEAMSSKTSPSKSRPDDSDTSASLGKELRSAINEGTTKKADIKPTKEEPLQNVGDASVGLEQMFEDKPKLSLTDKIEDLEMLLNSEINKYKASRGRSKETTRLFGPGTSWNESCSRRSKKSDVATCDRPSRAKSRMSSATDRQFQDVREKPQSENESLKSERNSCRDNSPPVQTPQRDECRKFSNRSNKFRGLYTRLEDFISFSEGTGANSMPVKKSEADDASSITYLTPTSEEDERLNTILKQCLPTSSKLSMSKRRRVESRSKKNVASKEETMPAPGKKQNDRTFNDSCQSYSGRQEPSARATPITRSNKSFSKTPHHPKETPLIDQLDELPHARSHQIKDWSPEFKSMGGAGNMDISSASSSDIVLSWVGSCSNLDEDVTPDIPPQPCNKDLTKDAIKRAQESSPASRKNTSQTPWVKNNNEFSKVWEEDRDRFHRWRLGVNTKEHLSVTEEMVFEEVDEKEYYEDQSGPVGDNGERTGPVFDGFLQTYIGSDINNFLYQGSELNQEQELDGQDASVEPFNFPNYQSNLSSTRKDRAPNQKRGMHAYSPSPMPPSRSTSFSDGREDDVGMAENRYFKNACSSSQNLTDRPRSTERRKRARRSRHYDKTVNNDTKSMRERERNPMPQRRHTFRVDTPDRLPDLFPTDQEKGRYVQSAWEYQKIRSIPRELSPRPAEDRRPPCSQGDDDHLMRQDQDTERDSAMKSYSRDQFVSIRYRARGQHDLSPNSARSSDCLSSAERRDLGGSVPREEAAASEKCASGRHRWHSSETLISGVSPGKRTWRKDRSVNREPSEKQSCFGKQLSFKNKLSLHQHLSTKPTTDECAATNDNSNSSRASVNWYRPQSLSSSTSVQNGPTGGSSASGAAAAAAMPITERPTCEGASVAASLGVNQGGGGAGRLSLDTPPIRVNLGSSTASRAVPHGQVLREMDRNRTTPSVGKIVQMFEQKRYQ